MVPRARSARLAQGLPNFEIHTPHAARRALPSLYHWRTEYGGALGVVGAISFSTSSPARFSIATPEARDGRHCKSSTRPPGTKLTTPKINHPLKLTNTSGRSRQNVHSARAPRDPGAYRSRQLANGLPGVHQAAEQQGVGLIDGGPWQQLLFTAWIGAHEHRLASLVVTHGQASSVCSRRKRSISSRSRRDQPKELFARLMNWVSGIIRQCTDKPFPSEVQSSSSGGERLVAL